MSRGELGYGILFPKCIRCVTNFLTSFVGELVGFLVGNSVGSKLIDG